ncbi:hypothetical protein C8R43DRAFT_117025 [Mycena crocata]|nr:hypothetical protein C8R43DRAFT_117025 [Mycena crocata]
MHRDTVFFQPTISRQSSSETPSSPALHHLRSRTGSPFRIHRQFSTQGSELVHDVAHRLNDGLGEVCMGVSFETTMPIDVIRTRAFDGIGRLRFIAPILACSIVSDQKDEMKRSWVYSSPSDLSSWISDTLSVRMEHVDLETFILEMNARRLPYVHSDGHQQPVHFYLLIGTNDRHHLFMHGPHSIMDARPVLRGFDLLLEWMAQPPPDPISSLPWGTEWNKLPAGPVTATGGARNDWDTTGLSMMQEINEIRANPVPSLCLAPSQDRQSVLAPVNMIRVHAALDVDTSTQIVQAIKTLGYSMSHLADAALAQLVFDWNPDEAALPGAHFTLDPTLVSQDKFLLPVHTGHSHFIAGLCTVPVQVPCSAALLQGPRRARILATMEIVKKQYDRYVGNPNLPHLLSAQLALRPIRGARIFRDPCTPLTSNVGRVESFLKSKWGPSQAPSEKAIITVTALSVGHRLGWKRP